MSLWLNSLPGSSALESLGPNRSGLSIFSFFGKPVVVPTIIPVIAVANMLIDIPAIMLIEYVTSPFNSLDLKDSPKMFYYITGIHQKNSWTVINTTLKLYDPQKFS